MSLDSCANLKESVICGRSPLVLVAIPYASLSTNGDVCVQSGAAENQPRTTAPKLARLNRRQDHVPKNKTSAIDSEIAIGMDFAIGYKLGVGKWICRRTCSPAVPLEVKS